MFGKRYVHRCADICLKQGGGDPGERCVLWFGGERWGGKGVTKPV